MSDYAHTLDELNGFLEKAQQVLKERDVPLLRIHSSQAMEDALGVEMDDPRLDNLAEAVRPGAHAFYWWVDVADPETLEAERMALRIWLWQDGLRYDWTLGTEAWYELLRSPEGEEDFDGLTDSFGRPIPELSKEQAALAKRLEEEPEAVLDEFVRVSVEALSPNDLRPQPWKVARIGEQELGLRDLPWGIEARDIAQDLMEKARQQIELKLVERVDNIIGDLVEDFPAWYQRKSEPRLTKALVKMYVQEQGYQAPGTFVDDLKVRIDVAMMKAA